MYGTFQVRSFEFSLGSFSALCKLSDVKIVKRLLLPSVFIEFQPNFMENMVIRGENRLLRFLMIRQNLKMLWHFALFVNTGPYGAGNFQTLLLIQVSSDVNQTKTLANIGECRLLRFLAIRQVTIFCDTL